MSYSAVSIVNMALAGLGQEKIRTLEDQSSIARSCREIYPIARDYVLSRGDWPCARKTGKLVQINTTHPMGIPFALPSDCLKPRFLYPRAQKPATFIIEGKTIIIPRYLISSASPFEVYLVYTRFLSDTSYFTIPFIKALSAEIIAQLVVPVLADPKIAQQKRNEAEFIIDEAVLTDSSPDSDCNNEDDNPRNDTFVNPDAGQLRYNGNENT